MNIDAPPRDDAWCIVDEKKYECTCGRTREKREASECYQHPFEWVKCVGANETRVGDSFMTMVMSKPGVMIILGPIRNVTVSKFSSPPAGPL